MLELKALSPVIPVFTLVAVGYLFAHFRKISLASITEFTVYLAAPCLVFTSLAVKPLIPADITVILGGAAGILIGVATLSWVYARLFHFRSPGFFLPVLFMNAGNMGIPLALFAFGEPGLQRATLFYVVMASLHNSLGVYLLSGKAGWREIFRLPLIYATGLGLLVNLSGLHVPAPFFEALRLLGFAAIPLMLVSLGYRLHSIHSLTWGHSIGGVFLRMGGGFLAAFATVTLLGIEGVNRQVILLYGSLPSAVVNFILTEKYGQNPELAASIIMMGTLASLVTVPLVLHFIT